MKKLLKIQYYEAATSLRVEIKIKLRCNVCDETTVKEKCDV